jgi:hypothetical protein
MTSKLRIENIDEAAQKLTDAIIKHFTEKVKGQGYFYKDQDWFIKKIVKLHLSALTLTDKDPILYVVTTSNILNAKPGATGKVLRKYHDGGAMYLFVEWDRDIHYVGNQQNGSYNAEHFKIIDKATYDKIRAGNPFRRITGKRTNQ